MVTEKAGCQHQVGKQEQGALIPIQVVVEKNIPMIPVVSRHGEYTQCQ